MQVYFLGGPVVAGNRVIVGDHVKCLSQHRQEWSLEHVGRYQRAHNPMLHSSYPVNSTQCKSAPCNTLTSPLRSLLPNPMGDRNSEVQLYWTSWVTRIAAYFLGRYEFSHNVDIFTPFIYQKKIGVSGVLGLLKYFNFLGRLQNYFLDFYLIYIEAC